MYVLLSMLDRERQNTKCMYYYQWWTGRDKVQNVCIIINAGQGETKYKMHVLLSTLDRRRQNIKCMYYYQRWTGRNKIQNVCIIINVRQGETKYKMYVLLSTLDREKQNTKCMYYYQRWTGGHKIQNICIIINVGQGNAPPLQSYPRDASLVFAKGDVWRRQRHTMTPTFSASKLKHVSHGALALAALFSLVMMMMLGLMSTDTVV